ncbi:MAG: hypothetical protein WAT34_12135 [Chitinophagaceae bacterium]
MKQILAILIALLIVNTMVAQVVRDHRTDKLKKPADKLEIMTPVGQNVVLYEQGNYQGQSKVLGPGVYRFFDSNDFNDMASSIKVSAGMAVIIFENANEMGGYGMYTDLLEDCPDLNVYNFNDKVSYINVINTVKPEGFVWARNRMKDNQFVPGHWERKRANGVLPDNAPPAIVSTLAPTFDAADASHAPQASQAEIDEFNAVQKNQLGVGVLGGETTRPFYYHHNQSGEEVYKYKKVIDPARLPGKFFDWASEKLGRAGIIIKPFEVLTDVAGDIKDWIFGSSSTKMEMDCWYPDSEFKKTVCGKMEEDVEICTQDYSHTQVTIDKDVCFNLMPSETFRSMLTNRWTGETHGKIEGEVKTINLANYNPQTQKSTETTTPRNPLLMEIKKDENVCFFGPWMGDILDINVKVPIPFTDASIDIGNINLRNSNEIHPINQFWRKKGNETQLIAMADGTGYFQKTGNNEIAASGINQRMRFYMAFFLPPHTNALMAVNRIYDVNGVAFEFMDNPVLDIQPETVTLKLNGATRVTVNDNSVIRNQKTHRVFFDKVRARPNGAVQGYIVIETEPIRKKGGSINVFVKDQTVDNSPVSPVKPVNSQ